MRYYLAQCENLYTNGPVGCGALLSLESAGGDLFSVVSGPRTIGVLSTSDL